MGTKSEKQKDTGTPARTGPGAVQSHTGMQVSQGFWGKEPLTKPPLQRSGLGADILIARVWKDLKCPSLEDWLNKF